jgi:hypothetical protein
MNFWKYTRLEFSPTFVLGYGMVLLIKMAAMQVYMELPYNMFAKPVITALIPLILNKHSLNGPSI